MRLSRPVSAPVYATGRASSPATQGNLGRPLPVRQCYADYARRSLLTAERHRVAAADAAP